MKRILFAFCLVCTAVLLALPSCRKVETPVPEEGEIVAFDIKVVYDDGPATRVVKTEWEVGDKLFLFFLRNSGHYLSNNNYATLTYNGATWDVSTNVPFTWSNGFNGSGTMYAVYFPFGNVVHPGTENFRCSGYDNAAMNSIPPFSWYMIDEGSPFTVTAAVPNNLNKWVLSGTLHMQLPDNFVYFYIAEEDGLYCEDGKYRLSVDGVRPATVINWSSGEFTLPVYESGQPMWGFKYKDGIAFAGIIDNTWTDPAEEHRFIFFSDGDPAVTKVFSGKTLDSHESVKLLAPTSANGWTRYMAAPVYVDIAGNKWAKWFLGSTDEDDKVSDIRFRWAEIVPDKGSPSESYDHFATFMDHDMTGDWAIFDPARAILGRDWRMPTRSDFSSLIANTTLSTTEFFYTLTSGDDAVSFVTYNALHNAGGSNYMWTSQKADKDHIYVREYHYAEASISESSSGEQAKRMIGVHFIRPIYIGDVGSVEKEGYTPTPLQ